MFEIKGKVALVTGGTSGIGLAYVKELLENDLKGVAILGVDVAKGQLVLSEVAKQFGRDRVIFIKTDVCDKEQFKEAFEEVVRTFGQLDIVINNAGIVHEFDWEKCVAVNLTGVITGCMLAIEKYLPKYKSGSEGVIVNTASMFGLDPVPGIPIYSSTKAGVVGLTRSLGSEMRYRETKVRVLAICPGLVDTPLINPNIMQNKVLASQFLRLMKLSESYPIQKPSDLATNVINVIKDAPTGSIWLTLTKNNFGQVKFPTYSAML